MEETNPQRTDSDLGERNRSSRTFWGAALILFGILFIAKNLGFIDLRDAVSTYWPLILIVIGIQIIFKSGWRRSLK